MLKNMLVLFIVLAVLILVPVYRFWSLYTNTETTPAITVEPAKTTQAVNESYKIPEYKIPSVAEINNSIRQKEEARIANEKESALKKAADAIKEQAAQLEETSGVSEPAETVVIETTAPATAPIAKTTKSVSFLPEKTPVSFPTHEDRKPQAKRGIIAY